MKILFLGAHTDEELCFGGMIIKSISNGHDAHYLTFDTGTANLDELKQSCEVMGCSVDFEPICTYKYEMTSQGTADYLFRIRDRFDLVVTHDVTDRHPLHRMVAEESHRVFNCNLITYVGAWNGPEQSNYFVELTEQQLETKIRALECYKSQAHRPYMNPDFIRAQARYNGMRCGKLYAEGFKVVRLVEKL